MYSKQMIPALERERRLDRAIESLERLTVVAKQANAEKWARAYVATQANLRESFTGAALAGRLYALYASLAGNPSNWGELVAQAQAARR